MDDDELLMLYDGPTSVLEGRDLASIAKYIQSPQCKQVFVILGPGVSSEAGIPDFRSRSTELYATLAKFNLPYPRAVLELNYFRFNPLPLYTLTRDLYTRCYRPTLTHIFVKLLSDRGLLHTCFTQNVDTLERQAGIPPERIVEAHGTFASQRCIDCKQEVDHARMRAAVEAGDVLYCEQEGCGGLVKPDLILFGESSLEPVTPRIPTIHSADLLFVIGSSLTTEPFAKLTALAPERCPRVLINLDFAGDIGMRADDVILFGRSDEVLQELAGALGWADELERETTKATFFNAASRNPGIEVQSLPDPTAVPLPDPTEDFDLNEKSLLRGVVQSEVAEDHRANSTNGTNTPTTTDWPEKLVVAESLSERLRLALESSEKVVPLREEAAVTFAARTLSSEELLLGSNTGYDGGPADSNSMYAGTSPVAPVGRT